MMRKTAFFFFVITLFCLQTAWSRTVIVAMDASWPPMEFVDDHNELVGFSVDFMRAVAKEAGFQVEFRNVPWNDILENLAAGKYDAVCSSLSITEERSALVDFSLPYFWDRTIRQALVTLKTSHAGSIEEMRGSLLGAQAGTTGYALLNREQGITPRSYRTIESAMEDLLTGEIDGVVVDDPVAREYTVHKARFAWQLKVAAIVEGGAGEYYGVAVRKGNRELRDLIDRGIEAVQARGIDRELRSKWLEHQTSRTPSEGDEQE